jgi:hypothetical protein
MNIAVTGADTAWMLGSGFPTGPQCPADGLDVDQWNGTAWTLLPAAAPVAGQSGFNGAIAASSASNVWVFPVAPGPGNTFFASAENWNGASWSVSSLPVRMEAQAALAFSRNDAWVFGPTARLHVAAHYNGASWQPASLPGEPMAVSALAANDIWAAGPSDRTARLAPSRQVIILMHWNGRYWQTVSTPRIRLPKGERPVISGLVALGPKNAWWSYTPETSAFKVRPGSAMLHWNGKHWTSVRLPAAAAGGGLNSTDLSMFWIPHSRSLWAIGYAHASSDAIEALTERYTS